MLVVNSWKNLINTSWESLYIRHSSNCSKHIGKIGQGLRLNYSYNSPKPELHELYNPINFFIFWNYNSVDQDFKMFIHTINRKRLNLKLASLNSDNEYNYICAIKHTSNINKLGKLEYKVRKTKVGVQPLPKSENKNKI